MISNLLIRNGPGCFDDVLFIFCLNLISVMRKQKRGCNHFLVNNDNNDNNNNNDNDDDNNDNDDDNNDNDNNDNDN